MLTGNFYSEFRKTHTRPYFVFPDVPPIGEFTFERLTEGNFEQLFLLFEGADSQYIDERFKSYNSAREYAQFNSICGASLPKHGSQDWLFKWLGKYAGILHLYDLSLETFGENHKRAWIGFATSEKFQGMGLTHRVVSYFIQYIFNNYPVVDFIHAMTYPENRKAIALLRKCGFELDIEERIGKRYTFFINKRMQ